MSYLDLIRELLGKQGTRVILLILVGVFLTYYIPKYFVTVPVFAQAMERVQRQMQQSTSLLELQWINTRLTDLRQERRQVTNQSRVKEIDEEISCLERKKEQLNTSLKRSW